jgi:phospholipase/carboxylesterase
LALVNITQHLSSGSLPKKSPVVVLLHGYGANMRDLVSLMGFLPGLPWVSLQGQLDAGNGGFCWAPRTIPGNPAAADVALGTDAIWNWLDANLPKDTPLVLLGFSQGGLMVTQLLRTQPKRIKAAVILAGFTIPAAQPADGELLATKPQVFYGRGQEDQIIDPDALARTRTWLELHTQATTRIYPGLGHSIDEREMNDVAEYLESVL